MKKRNQKNKMTTEMVGRVFGGLTVVAAAGKNKYGKLTWECLCSYCNNTTIKVGTYLRSKNVRSCGCRAKNAFVDHTGTSVNSLKLLEYIEQNKYGCFMYKIQCRCGTVFKAEGNDILSGKIKSCGCARIVAAQSKARPREESIFLALYRDYKVKARQRQYTFTLTETEFRTLVFDNCYYCGSAPANIKKLKSWPDTFIKYNGVDRRDNKLGYSIDNCVTACYTCNQAKHRMSENVFLQWIQTIAKFQAAKETNQW